MLRSEYTKYLFRKDIKTTRTYIFRKSVRNRYSALYQEKYQRQFFEFFYVRVSSEENNFTLEIVTVRKLRAGREFMAYYSSDLSSDDRNGHPKYPRNECDLFSIPVFFWRKVCSLLNIFIVHARLALIAAINSLAIEDLFRDYPRNCNNKKNTVLDNSEHNYPIEQLGSLKLQRTGRRQIFAFKVCVPYNSI